MLVWLIIVVFILGYFFYGVYELCSPEEKLRFHRLWLLQWKPRKLNRKFFNHNLVYIFAGGALCLGLYFGIAGYRGGEQFDANLATEFVSVAITIFIIDWLNARRAEEQRKAEIIEQIESPVRDAAVEAIRLARKYNFLDEALQSVRLEKHDLQRVNLQGANLQQAHLWEADLQKADLSAANLQGAWLQGANLQEATLQGANLKRAYLPAANLQKAYLWDADLQGATLEGANLQEATLQRANLQGAILEGANLQRAFLFDADLQGANLQGADLQGALLLRTNLQGANLQGADLQGGYLWEANLQGANLQEAYLQGVSYDIETNWPSKFDRLESGAILRTVEEKNDR